MDRKNNRHFSSFGKQLTSTVSVALVLLILGIVGALAIAGNQITDSIRQNIGFTLVMQDDADDTEINRLKHQFNTAPYVASYEFLPAEEILRQEEALIGEDIEAVIGINPYQPEFNIKVKPQYASVDSIDAIVSTFRDMTSISDASVNSEMVDRVNANIRTLSFVLLGVALALLAISFVLINNTVRLTIYSRRFLLHTMRLVGATGGFIRRPIIVRNIVNGTISGVLASLLLCILVWAVHSEPEIGDILQWNDLTVIFAGMIATGIVICALAAWIATNKYLRQSYDDMF